MLRVLTLAFLGVGLVACGGDDSSGSPAGGDPGATGAGATGSGGTGGTGGASTDSGGAGGSDGAGASGGAAGESGVTGSGGTGTGGTGAAGSGGSGGSVVGARCDEGDTVTLDDTTYDEAPSASDDLVCDPQIMAVYYDDLVNTGAGYNLLLHYDWDADGRAFGNFVSINLYGVDAGEYAIGSDNGEADLIWMLAGDVCLADSGSVTIDSVGDVGGVVEGSLEIDSFASDACPDSVAGSFRMTIVDSSSLSN